MSEKSKKNKTIDFDIQEGQKYLDNAVRFKSDIKFEQIINKNIIGDTFEVLDFIDDNSIDLLIVDPPYNLRKNYHGNIFTEKNTTEYESYTDEWLKKNKT